jgi:hypothetical protein
MRSYGWDTFMCLDLSRGHLLVERCLLGVKTTSDEVEYQFILDHWVEKIQKEGDVSYCVTSSEVVSSFIYSFLPIFHLSEVCFLDLTLVLVEMCLNRRVWSYIQKAPRTLSQKSAYFALRTSHFTAPNLRVRSYIQKAPRTLSLSCPKIGLHKRWSKTIKL